MVIVGANNIEISMMIKSKTIKKSSKGWQWQGAFIYNMKMTTKNNTTKMQRLIVMKRGWWPITRLPNDQEDNNDNVLTTMSQTWWPRTTSLENHQEDGGELGVKALKPFTINWNQVFSNNLVWFQLLDPFKN